MSVQENAFGPGSPLLAELAGRLIGPPLVSIQASRRYYLIMNRQRDDLILCLLNRSTGSRGTFESHGVAAARTPIEGPELVTVTVLEGLLGKIRSAELLDSKDQVNLSRQLGMAKIVFEASPSATLLRLRRDTQLWLISRRVAAHGLCKARRPQKKGRFMDWVGP